MSRYGVEVRSAERAIRLLRKLESRRLGVSLKEFADETEVSVRTIYRDADALRAAGEPVACVDGRLYLERLP